MYALWPHASPCRSPSRHDRSAVGPVRGHDAPPWHDRAVRLRHQYLQIDSTNAPVNELKTAPFYKSLLEPEGIPVTLDEFAPGRANLLATLKGSGTRRPLILANHMDVVPADPSRWSVAPFSGLLKDGLVYGRERRGHEDQGVVQLPAMLRLKMTGATESVLYRPLGGRWASVATASRPCSPPPRRPPPGTATTDASRRPRSGAPPAFSTTSCGSSWRGARPRVTSDRSGRRDPRRPATSAAPAGSPATPR
jgi:hypothetical protein